MILDKWVKAIEEKKEIIALGNFNLNTMRWEVPVQDKTSYERAQTPLVEAFSEKVLENGFNILNSTPTRTKDTVESKPSCLDLILTNRLSKIINYESGISSFSDHSSSQEHKRN